MRFPFSPLLARYVDKNGTGWGGKMRGHLRPISCLLAHLWCSIETKAIAHFLYLVKAKRMSTLTVFFGTIIAHMSPDTLKGKKRLAYK